MSQIKDYTHITYTRIEPNIHYFLMKESSRKAVDEFIAVLESSIEDVEGQLMHTLMDSSVGVQPLRYIFAQLHTSMKRYPEENRIQSKSKLALILPSDTLTNFVKGLMRSFPQLRTRIFKPGEDDKALEWLRE